LINPFFFLKRNPAVFVRDHQENYDPVLERGAKGTWGRGMDREGNLQERNTA